MIKATDRNTINHDNYQFSFNKLLTLKGNKIQNDVSTQEMVKADGFRLASTIFGIIGTCFMIYNYMSPDTTVKTAGHVATSATNILNRASTLVNGTSSMSGTAAQMFHHFGYGEEKQRNQFIEKIQEVNFNRNGQKYLKKLYVKNEEFREETINFVRDYKALDIEVILNRRYKTNTLSMTGKKYLAECVVYKDKTQD